ncbi:phosphoadenylyl-sulfate reductase [Flavisolibacter nicotianae]|uniref:phosphoadenylyl-sulfate reductase n=1 Tax=Flavisolibacter nicotianae TaxID=2364882 RepID=UPI000EAD18CA|nr:phosphoadenylyl-sulfate reductase [Flavisolibacter nicotianae]
MSIVTKDSFLSLQDRVVQLSIPEVLKQLSEAFPGGLTFSTSFGMEDQVITDQISQSGVPVNIFTLDTGRLFPETYSTWSRTLERYSLPIDAYYPNAEKIQEFVRQYGPNSFYESVERRKECCHIRKVEPLKKALAGKSVWITGLRAEQSAGRSEMHILEWDDSHQLIKYNPLLHWTTDDVRNYINQHNVPYNSLHDKGFVSIGCAPCTRAVRPGEDFRAGRWWWEDQSKKECGLHVHQVTTN